MENEEKKEPIIEEEARPAKELEIDESLLSEQEKTDNKIKFSMGMLIFIIVLIVIIVGLSIAVALL